MHDFYPSHLNQGLIPVSHSGHSSPPHHQIHNPTPSYASHSNLGPMNNSSSPYHTLNTAMASSSITITTDNNVQQQIDRNESPVANSHYSSSLQLPPTPNSLVTIVGPNSGNSNNSNDAVPLHQDDNIESSDTAAASAQAQLLSINNNNNNNNNHYSPWTNSVSSVVNRPMPPLSPPEFFQQLGVMGSSNSSVSPSLMTGNQMHHHPHIMSTGMTHLHHNNVGGPPPPPPSFMQQSLPNFAAHTTAKNFGMPQPYYSWY